MVPKTKEIDRKSSQEEDAWGVPRRWGGSPRLFPIDFSRFEVHLSCSVWVLRRDSISAHVWYGLRTNLIPGLSS